MGHIACALIEVLNEGDKLNASWHCGLKMLTYCRNAQSVAWSGVWGAAAREGGGSRSDWQALSFNLSSSPHTTCIEEKLDFGYRNSRFLALNSVVFTLLAHIWSSAVTNFCNFTVKHEKCFQLSTVNTGLAAQAHSRAAGLRTARVGGQSHVQQQHQQVWCLLLEFIHLGRYRNCNLLWSRVERRRWVRRL